MFKLHTMTYPYGQDPKVVVITGAGGAIGSTVAEYFASRGWSLALFDRASRVSKLQDQYPEASVHIADLTQSLAVRRATAEVISLHGKVDALLCLAGGFAIGEAVHTDFNNIEAQISVNFKTLFEVTSSLLPHMVNRQSGFILGIAAAAALRGGSRMSAYGASKGALVGYLRSLRAEVGPSGLSVSILYPMGTVDTLENRRTMPDANPDDWISRQQIAETIYFLATRRTGGLVHEISLHAN